MVMGMSPDELLRRREYAERLLRYFAKFTKYKYGEDNPHIQWLDRLASLPMEQAVAFLNTWYPISRHQPQILLFLTSLFPEQADRKRMFLGNIIEEDGYKKDMDPHYDLLGKVLIPSLGGTLTPDPVTEQLNLQLHEWMMANLRTPAQAAGALAAIENVALDVSRILRTIVRLCGRSELLEDDVYLKIHVAIEPEHIIDTHEMAKRYMERSEQEKTEVVETFQYVVEFWQKFWPLAFAKIGYVEPVVCCEKCADCYGEQDACNESCDGCSEQRPACCGKCYGCNGCKARAKQQRGGLAA